MRHLITAGCFASALTAYYFGLEASSGFLFVVGALFEIISFKRLSNRARSSV